MIVVTVELWPKGDANRRRELAHMKIDYAPDSPAAPAPEQFEIEAVEHPTKERATTLRTAAAFSHARGAGIFALVRNALAALKWPADEAKP
ncbi:MAG: hypothetical protein QM651_02240 [Rhodoblastus sp.]